MGNLVFHEAITLGVVAVVLLVAGGIASEEGKGMLKRIGVFVAIFGGVLLFLALVGIIAWPIIDYLKV